MKEITLNEQQVKFIKEMLEDVVIEDGWGNTSKAIALLIIKKLND